MLHLTRAIRPRPPLVPTLIAVQAGKDAQSWPALPTEQCRTIAGRATRNRPITRHHLWAFLMMGPSIRYYARTG